MRKRDIPCVPDCPRRSPTCHTNCPDYAAFVEKVAAERQARRVQSELDHADIMRRTRFFNILKRGTRRNGERS